VLLPKIDHAVINVHYDMDVAEGLFRKLGFHLTDRGYHSLGSINHLMMFGDDYLEMIGLPADTKGLPPGRPEVLAAPVGINGLVFKTDDADTVYQHLKECGMAGDPPKSFSRPVELDDATCDAHFRTVTVSSDGIGGGRVYFCDHKTPDLVWHNQWQGHTNGAQRICEFVLVSDNHLVEAERLAALLALPPVDGMDQNSIAIDGAVLRVLSPQAYAARYGDLASPLDNRGSLFGALVISVSDLSTIRSLASKSGLLIREIADSLVLRIPAFDCVLEFREEDR